MTRRGGDFLESSPEERGGGGNWGCMGRRQIRSQSDRASRPLFPLPPDKFDALLYGIQDKTRKDGGMHLRCQKVRMAGRHDVASAADSRNSPSNVIGYFWCLDKVIQAYLTLQSLRVVDPIELLSISSPQMSKSLRRQTRVFDGTN